MNSGQFSSLLPVSSLPFLKAHLFFQNNLSDETMPSDKLLRATKFFQFLSLESEIHGVFKPVARRILQGMQQINCIPVLKGENIELEVDTQDVGWTRPSQVLLGDSCLRKIISPTELKQYLDLSYMSEVVLQNASPALLKALGVHTESLDILLELCMSHLKLISEQKGELLLKNSYLFYSA